MPRHEDNGGIHLFLCLHLERLKSIETSNTSFRFYFIEAERKQPTFPRFLVHAVCEVFGNIASFKGDQQG
jgi:hypothetical protein